MAQAGSGGPSLGPVVSGPGSFSGTTDCSGCRRRSCSSPRIRGRQGLVHLASKGAALRHYFIQRPLYGAKDLVWRPLAHPVLQNAGGLGFKESVFLVDFKSVASSSLTLFYQCVFNVWKLVLTLKLQHKSLHWLVLEPLGQGGLVSAPSWAGRAGGAVINALKRAGLSSLRTLVDYTGLHLQDVSGLAAALGWRAQSFVARLLDRWRGCLTRDSRALITPDPDDEFPSITICSSPDQHSGTSLKNAAGKELSVLLVEVLNQEKLQRRRLLPWKHLTNGEEVRPEWRSLYKPPLSTGFSRALKSIKWHQFCKN